MEIVNTKYKKTPLQTICFEVYLGRKISFAIINNHRDVAQSGSAPCSGRGGRKFKSCHPDIFQSINTRLLYLYPPA